MKKQPCKDCEKRTAECHAHCTDYLEWQEQKRIRNAKIRVARDYTYQGFSMERRDAKKKSEQR